VGISCKTIANFLIRRRWQLLLLGVLAAICAVIPASRLDYDRRVERMFAADDPLLLDYLRLKETFGGNELVLAVYDDPDLFHEDGSGIDRLASIRESLESVAGVAGTLTLDKLFGPFTTLEAEPIVRLRALFEGYTHGADQRTSCVVCMLDPSMVSQQQRAQTVNELRRTMEQLPDGLSGGIVTGEPVMMVDAYHYVEMDSRTLSIISTVLSALVILISLRSPRWVIIALVVVHSSLLSTKAVLSLAGFNLSLLSATLTAMVTVIGIATTIHILVHYKSHLSAGAEPVAALESALEKLLPPVFWACTTDATGFLALCLASVTPIREYGIMMAVGSMLVFVSTCLFVPWIALMRISAAHTATLAAAPIRLQWPRQLVERVTKRPGIVVLVGLLLGLISVMGFMRLETETDFTRNFRANTPIVQSYQTVETRLGGAGAFDVIIPAPEKLDWDYFEKTRRLERRLLAKVTVADENGSRQPALTKVLSLADAGIAASPKDIRSVRSIFRQTVITVGLGVFERRIPEFIKALHAPSPVDDNQYLFRIMLRTREQQTTDQKADIIRQVREICAAYSPEAKVTGFFVLLTNIVGSVMRDQWSTMAAAVLGIFLVTTVAFRSPLMALIGLAPNVVPIALVMGLMGWLGLKINLGGAMIAAVSLGLSIDSSVHFIYSYRRARSAGYSCEQALLETGGTVGRAMVLATLALIAGFVALCASPFIPTIYFGVLVSLAMLGGLLGNLLVLPALIKLTHRQ